MTDWSAVVGEGRGGEVRVRVRASSVLDGRKSEYGAKNAIDGDGSSCWNSGPSESGQWVELFFCGAAVDVTGIGFQFQGGFAPHTARVVWNTRGRDAAAVGDADLAAELVVADSNDVQRFALPPRPPATSLAIVFPSSTDFFGRITLYRLTVFGSVVRPDGDGDPACGATSDATSDAPSDDSDWESDSSYS